MQKFKIEAKVAKKDKSLEKIIQNCGIEYPHESLAFFSAIYAKFDEPNKNRVELASSVKKQVPQLRGTQVNINHYRRNWIVGTILDAWVEKDTIKIAFSFYKSVYPDIYEQAVKLLDDGELAVSFELHVDNADIEEKSGGVRRLKKVSFDGVGFLLGETPACPEAMVYEQANINSLRERDLVFANKFKYVSKQEEDIVDKKTNDALLAKQKEIVISEFGEDAVKDWSDEDFLNDDKISALRESLKAETTEEVEDKKEETSEENAEETSKEEETSEEKSEDASEEEAQVQKVEEETKTKQTMEYDDETQEEKRMIESETVTKVNDEIKQVRKQLEEVLFKAEELEQTIEAKDKEIAFLKENAQKIVALRNELGSYAENLSDEELFNEEKVELARLRKENDELKGKKVETASEEKEESDEEKEEVSEDTAEEKIEETNEEKVEEAEEKSEEDEDLDTGHEEPELINRDEAVRDYIKNRAKNL